MTSGVGKTEPPYGRTRHSKGLSVKPLDSQTTTADDRHCGCLGGLGWFRLLVAPSATLSVIYREVLRQAGMLAFNDTFWLLCIGTAFLVPVTLLFRRGSADGRQEVLL